MSNDMFDVNDLIAGLDANKDSAGSLSFWRVNMDKVQQHRVEIMRLPLQARIVIKAILVESGRMDDVSFKFTVPMIADWAKTHGLETKQQPDRIVRYYFKQLKSFVLDSAK